MKTKCKRFSFNIAYLYLLLSKIHGKAATSVSVNGNTLTKYNSLYDLEVASGEGWAIGSDIYGSVTYVKVSAGNAKSVVITGNDDIIPTPTPVAHAVPGLIEAENYDSMSGVQIENCGEEYRQYTATVNVTNGQLDIGFYIYASGGNANMQINDVELVRN